MALARRKRKVKPKPKAAGCTPLRKRALVKKSKAKAPTGRAAARGSSAGGGGDATAAAKRKAALAREKPRRCAPRKAAKKPVREPISPRPAPAAAAPAAAQAPAAAAPTTPPAAAPTPPPAPTAPATASGFGRREAQRLLWRAACGPRPGEVDRLVALGREAAVEHLLAPGRETFEGPAATASGVPIKPYETWGHDHLQLLDAMVRTSDGLRRRMTLVWHDWFACSVEKAPGYMMLRQLHRISQQALGSFDDLARDMTSDPAMLDFLDGLRNTKGKPNENHARELFELFTLGANRGAYTERDIREAARAMTGWTATWNGTTFVEFRFDPARFDSGTKTIFGQTGAFGWQDVVRLALEHPAHPSWFVTRLWRAFVAEPADAATQRRLERLYVDSGRQIAPVVREILLHPRFYEGPSMVVPPAVVNAGLLRAIGRPVDTDAWAWIGAMCGQMLLRPPNVSGWTEDAWLGSAAFEGRWTMATWALRPSAVDPAAPYDATETPETALQRALAHLADPVLTPETHAALLRFAAELCPPTLPSWQRSRRRAMRQNALRMLIATSSDLACA